MHHLYNGNEGYSPEASLKKRTLPGLWAFLRGQALSLLGGVLYDLPAKAALEKLPFELWEAENGFGDNFSILYMQVPIAEFAELARDAEDSSGGGKYRVIAEAMKAKGQEVRFISMDALEGSYEDVDTPELKSTSDAVELALENLNTLLQHSRQGPASAVDRIHTALHAHLIYLCEKAGQTPGENMELAPLFSLLRKGQPAFQSDTVFRGLAKVVHALSPVRNSNSLAHPTDHLLEEPEAMLVLNAGRTLLRYLDSRFNK